jgi:hypothetical protein
MNRVGFLVTEVRDELIEQSDVDKNESARLRRWIAGKFVTFERWGWLKKDTDTLKERDYFTVLPKLHMDLDPKPTKSTGIVMPSHELDEENIGVFAQISNELEQYRKRIITQISEIEEYKRVEITYPELKKIATHRFQEVVDENYRLLGKVKALENLMTSAEEQS